MPRRRRFSLVGPGRGARLLIGAVNVLLVAASVVILAAPADEATWGWTLMAVLTFWATTNYGLWHFTRHRGIRPPVVIVVYWILAALISTAYFLTWPEESSLAVEFGGAVPRMLHESFQVIALHYMILVVVVCLLEARLQRWLEQRRSTAAPPSSLGRTGFLFFLALSWGLILSRYFTIVVLGLGVPGVEPTIQFRYIGGALTLISLIGPYVINGALLQHVLVRGGKLKWVVIFATIFVYAGLQLYVGSRTGLAFMFLLVAAVTYDVWQSGRSHSGVWMATGIAAVAAVLSVTFFQLVMDYRQAAIRGGDRGEALSSLQFDEESKSDVAVLLSRITGVEAIARVRAFLGDEGAAESRSWASATEYYTRVIMEVRSERTASSMTYLGWAQIQWGSMVAYLYSAFCGALIVLAYFGLALHRSNAGVRIGTQVGFGLILGVFLMGADPVLALKQLFVLYLLRYSVSAVAAAPRKVARGQGTRRPLRVSGG